MVGNIDSISFSNLWLLHSVAKGNQGAEGIYQDHEKREATSPKGRQNHDQDQQEEQHHQVQVENSQVPLDP